jgi:hypothetical protein
MLIVASWVDGREVLAMRLTWKDAVSTLFMGAIVAVYLAFRNGTSLWLISSARGATTAVFILGFVGGCALSAGSLYAGSQPRSAKAFQAIATILGITALAAAIVGLIAASTVALAVLATATLALWLTATIRHAFGIAAWPATPLTPTGSCDVHEVTADEVTDQELAGRR